MACRKPETRNRGGTSRGQAAERQSAERMLSGQFRCPELAIQVSNQFRRKLHHREHGARGVSSSSPCSLCLRGENKRHQKGEQPKQSAHHYSGDFIMSYYDDYRRANRPEPPYHELREQVKLLEDDLRRREDERREQEEWERRQEKQWWPGDPKEIEEPEPVIQTCSHIRENGAFCQSVALRGREYCRFHLRERGRCLEMARARARGERWRLDLPPLEDLYAVQVSIMRVLQALDHDRLDKGRGSLMLYGLQQAATNLRCPQEVWERSCRFDNVEEVQWDGFEQEHGLPKNFDVDTPPEVAFPPPAAGRDSTEVALQERKAEANRAAAGAPLLSAFVADRVGPEPDEAAKKDPQRVAAEAKAADKIG